MILRLVVSRRRFNWFCCLILERDQGYLKLLGIFDKKSIFRIMVVKVDLADVCLPLVEETLKEAD